MDAGEPQLESDNHQNHAGRGEKPVQRYAQSALEEKDSHGNRDRDSEHGTYPDLYACARKLYRAQDQNQLRAFAHHHEEYECADAPSGRARRFLRVRLDPLLDLLPQRARHAVHPYDHGHDEHGGHQHQHALEAILVDRPALQKQGSGNARQRRPA